MNHYYSRDPTSSGKKTTIKTSAFGIPLIFKSQSGIFNWKKVDTGSEVLLHATEIPSQPKLQILDLGCGYGYLGIALAKRYPEIKVVLADINTIAVRMTRINCEINNVKSNTEVYQSDLFESLPHQLYDVILSNPPIMAGKKTLRELINQSKTNLKANGSLQLVVPKKKGLTSIKDMITKTFGSYKVLEKQSGYWILKAINY
ncbi:MAG: methyltransferase [Asgard group archaeon]|nr:methyltransferase [Asgard group archaeon]